MVRHVLFVGLLATCLVLLITVGQRHAWQWDLSAGRLHSLTPSAEHALDALPAPLEIIAFVPDYAVQRAETERLLAPYLAHRSRPRFRFVDPVAEPAVAREHGVRRHGELHLRSGKRVERLRGADSAAIDTALNRLALRGERWVVVFTGHGESPLSDAPGGLRRLVTQAEQLGYRFVAIDPRHTDDLPENTAVLLVAGPRQDYPPAVEAQVQRYIARGGAVWWLFDRVFPAWALDTLGVSPLPGIVVDASAAQFGLDSPDHAVVNVFPDTLFAEPPGDHAVLQQARGMTITAGADWQPVGELHSSPRSWNETGELQGRIARDPALGEQAGPITVAVALSNGTVQPAARIVVSGGRDWLGNDQLGRADNLALAQGLLNWLTANQQLAAPRVAADLAIDWSPTLAGILAITLMGVLPLAYAVTGWWLRGRRRRA